MLPLHISWDSIRRGTPRCAGPSARSGRCPGALQGAVCPPAGFVSLSNARRAAGSSLGRAGGTGHGSRPSCHEGGGPGGGRSPLPPAPPPARPRPATPARPRRGHGARRAGGGQSAAGHPARHRRGGGGRGRGGGRHRSEPRVSEPRTPAGYGGCAPLTPVPSSHPAFPAPGCPERCRTPPWAGFSFSRPCAGAGERTLAGSGEGLEHARGSAWKGTAVRARKIVPSPPGNAQGEEPRSRGRAGDGDLG